MARPEATFSPSRKRKLLILIGVAWLICVALFFFPLGSSSDSASEWRSAVTPRAALPRAPYAPWVHGHWLTTSMDHALQLVKRLSVAGSHVDAVLFQDDFFTIHNDYQGRLRQTAAALRRLNVHVVVVLDAIIPSITPEFAFAKAQSFCVENRDDAVYKRHIGSEEAERKGCLVNFNNPAAAKWFTNVVVKPVLQCGVEGLMLEPMVDTFMSLSTANGRIDKSEAYSADYYFSLFDYGRQVVGFDFVAVFRAVSSVGPSRAMRAIGPQDISFAAQVGGGEMASFEGLQETALHLLHSADRGYINAGVSIPDTFDLRVLEETKRTWTSELFLRWAQLASATSLMKVNTWIPPGKNPWSACAAADEDACRKSYTAAVTFHRSLRLYLHALGSTTFYSKLEGQRLTSVGGGVAAVAKKVDPRDHPHVLRTLHGAAFIVSDPDSWDFMIGGDLFVAPVLNASTNSNSRMPAAKRHVTFPAYGQWVPLMLSDTNHHAQKDTFFAPKSAVELDVGLDELLVFQRRGSILPVYSPSQLPVGAVQFVVEAPQHVRRRKTLQERYIPESVIQLVRQYSPKQSEDELDPEVAYVVGEHDHGAAVWYSTRLATPSELGAVTGVAAPKGAFMMDLVVTPYHRPIVIELRRVQSLFPADTAVLSAAGYHPMDSKQQFWSQGVRESGLRAVAVSEHDVLLFDPFSSLGNRLTLGPFVSL